MSREPPKPPLPLGQRLSPPPSCGPLTCQSRISGFPVKRLWQEWQVKWIPPSGLERCILSKGTDSEGAQGPCPPWRSCCSLLCPRIADPSASRPLACTLPFSPLSLSPLPPPGPHPPHLLPTPSPPLPLPIPWHQEGAPPAGPPVLLLLLPGGTGFGQGEWQPKTNFLRVE